MKSSSELREQIEGWLTEYIITPLNKSSKDNDLNLDKYLESDTRIVYYLMHKKNKALIIIKFQDGLTRIMNGKDMIIEFEYNPMKCEQIESNIMTYLEKNQELLKQKANKIFGTNNNINILISK